MERGDLDGAAKVFEQELAANPADQVAKTGLAQVNLIRRISSYDQAQDRRDAAERPSDVAAQIRVADVDLASGRVEEAFDRLLGVVRRTSGEERDQARKHLVSLFEILPPNDPQVKGPDRPYLHSSSKGIYNSSCKLLAGGGCDTGNPAESSRKLFWR